MATRRQSFAAAVWPWKWSLAVRTPPDRNIDSSYYIVGPTKEYLLPGVSSVAEEPTAVDPIPLPTATHIQQPLSRMMTIVVPPRLWRFLWYLQKACRLLDVRRGLYCHVRSCYSPSALVDPILCSHNHFYVKQYCQVMDRLFLFSIKCPAWVFKSSIFDDALTVLAFHAHSFHRILAAAKPFIRRIRT
jgi:hypothetical protein